MSVVDIRNAWAEQSLSKGLLYPLESEGSKALFVTREYLSDECNDFWSDNCYHVWKGQNGFTVGLACRWHMRCTSMKTNDPLIDATQNGVKDTMWACFQAGKMQANLEQLEANCYRLIRATTQKVGSSYEKKHGGLKPTTVNWDTLDMDLLMIAMEAVALVLDPRFERLKEEWKNDYETD